MERAVALSPGTSAWWLPPVVRAPGVPRAQSGDRRPPWGGRQGIPPPGLPALASAGLTSEGSASLRVGPPFCLQLVPGPPLSTWHLLHPFGGQDGPLPWCRGQGRWGEGGETACPEHLCCWRVGHQVGGSRHLCL